MKRFLFLLLLLLFLEGLHAQDTLRLTLEEAKSIARSRNPGLLASGEAVEQARAKVEKSRAAFFPQASFTGVYTRLGEVPKMKIDMGEMMGLPFSETVEIEMGEQNNYNYSVTVNQPLFAGGNIINSYKLSRLNLQATEYDNKKAESDLILQVEETYYNLLWAYDMLEVTKDGYAQLLKHLEQAESLYAAGMLSHFDLLRARVAKANFQPNLIRAKNGVRLAEDALKLLLGLPLDTPFVLVDSLSKPDWDITLEEAIESALSRRCELLSLEKRREMAHLALVMSKRAFLPTLVTQFSYSYQKPYQQQNKWGKDWNISLILNFDIFNGLSRIADVKSARSQLQQIDYAMKQTREGIKLEVRQAYLSFQEAQELLESQEANLSQAQEALRIAEEQYKNGLISQTEYTDAQMANNQAKVNYLQALVQYNTAIAKLKRAMHEE
ncbi:TolC family protein [bacterium]|nr:TolC family protein [bacterium]